MKKQLLQCFVALLLLGGLLAACESEPVRPVNEIENKDHADPVKMELTFTHGEFNSPVFRATPDAQTPALSRQVMTYALQKGKGWAPIEGSIDTLRYRQGKAYELRLVYYDTEGNNMTYQFTTGGQEKIHQHFFIPDSVFTLAGKGRASEKNTNKIFNYTYTDTTPWDKEYGTEGVTLNAPDNPLGFKGVFEFKEARRFLLNIQLMHARKSKISTEGIISPYYKPTAGQRTSDLWDVFVAIPMKAVQY